MSHYFSKNQTSELRLKKISAVLRKKQVEFYTGSGVFSKDKVDLGTQLLINKSVIYSNTEVLDLGCGYGAVGVSIAKFCPTTKVLMTDVNQRAVKLAKMNIKLHKLGNANVKQSNCFENIKKSFDIILLNPPQTAGKDLCFKMIEESKNHLNTNGTLQVVARHKKGGKSLKEKMLEVFDNAEEIAKGSGYRIYLSKKTED